MIQQNAGYRRLPLGFRSLGFGIVAAFFVVGAGCGRPSRPVPGGAMTRPAQEARKQAESYAVAAVRGAADAQVAAHPELDRRSGFTRLVDGVLNPPTITVSAQVPPAPEPPAPAVEPGPRAPGHAITPRTGVERDHSSARRATGPVVIREQVVTEIPYPTEGEAEEKTLELAAEKIAERLRELDPPVEYLPPRAVVKNEYATKRDLRRPPEFEANALASYDGKDRVYVEYTVELTSDQVREIRTRDRVGYGFRVLGIVTALSLAGFLFLRLDDWTKGYLTSWLAFVAVALAGGVVAALIAV